MAIKDFKFRNRALRRSFVVPREIDLALQKIQEHQGLANPSEAFRFCVAFTFDFLSQPQSPSPKEDRLLNLVSQSHLLLRYLINEVIKGHQGRPALNDREREYRDKLIQEIEAYYKKTQGESNG